MKKYLPNALAFTTLVLLIFLSCSQDEEIVTNPGTDPIGNTANDNDVEVPSAFQLFIDEVEVYVEGDFVIIKSNGVPNHGSPYFNQSDRRYEDYNGNNARFRLNPNRIAEQNYTFKIPLNPSEAANKQSTPMGAIGVSINGVPFYNQYAAGRSALDNEVDSFDQYNGHPQMTGGYHYHIEPLYLTNTEGKEAFLGFLLDGFPVYGPIEDGQKVINSDLDDFHGHFHATPEYPEGIYHYHITDEDPYLNGSGFFGTPGTVTQ